MLLGDENVQYLCKSSAGILRTETNKCSDKPCLAHVSTNSPRIIAIHRLLGLPRCNLHAHQSDPYHSATKANTCVLRYTYFTHFRQIAVTYGQLDRKIRQGVLRCINDAGRWP